MYEARQNKEKVLRTISGGRCCRVGQRVGIRNNGNSLIQKLQLRTPEKIDNKHVSQFMAWVITRELNLGMSPSSNSASSSSRTPQLINNEERIGGSSHGSSDSSGGAVSSAITLSPAILPIVGSDSSTNASSGKGSKYTISDMALGNNQQEELYATHLMDGGDIDVSQRNSALSKIFNLKFHHRHILFDKPIDLPVVGNSNNVGYGGRLYKETSLNGYVKNNKISIDNLYETNNGYRQEDELLKEAITEYQDYGPYNILTHNCQHWVNDVVAKFKNLKDQYQVVLPEECDYDPEIESFAYLRSFFFE